VQEASIAAVMQWPRDGVPDNPRRLAGAGCISKGGGSYPQRVCTEASRDGSGGGGGACVRDQLGCSAGRRRRAGSSVYVFPHPSLTPSSGIALTLRALGGLTTAEIANAFLVPEATMAERIARAKQTIKASGIPFQMPNAEERGVRLRSVLHVL